MKMRHLNLLLFTLVLIILSGGAIANPNHPHSSGEGKAMSHGMKAEHGGHGTGHAQKVGHSKSGGHGKGGLHMFGNVWMNTLSDEQKVAVDKMHLDVAKVEKLLHSKMETLKLELKLLAVKDKADIKAMSDKIHEIVKLKAEVMLNRYSHIAEMREALTPAQRVSYDMGVLNHGEKRGGKSH